MLEPYFSRSSTITRLRGGPLGADLNALATTLHQQGYTWESIRSYVRGCAQFGQWLSQHGYAVADVTPALVRQYISGLHRPPSGRLPEGAQGLSHLLQLWRQQNRLPERSHHGPCTEVDQWLLRYAQHLDQVCGVATSTCAHYLRLARRFLTACFPTGHVHWPSLHAQQITDFVRHEAAGKHGGGRKLPRVTLQICTLPRCVPCC